jgi:predicted ester cyclase
VGSREGVGVSTEENKAIYLRFVEHQDGGDLEASLAFTAPDALFNGQPFGREGDRQRSEMLAAAFPGARYDIQELVAEVDTLVARWRMTGTHQGALVGPTMTVPPTGKRVDVWGMSLYRIEGGMAKELWESFDMMEFLGQLGAIPSPGQPEEASPT